MTQTAAKLSAGGEEGGGHGNTIESSAFARNNKRSISLEPGPRKIRTIVITRRDINWISHSTIIVRICSNGEKYEQVKH